MTQTNEPVPSQPGYGQPQGYAQPGGAMPSKNIGWAVAAIFFFWPLAIYAFIQSGKVEPAWYRGDRAAAESASNSTKKAGIIAICVGVVLTILWIVIAVVAANHAADQINDYNSQLGN